MFLVVCATEFELQPLLDQELPPQIRWTSLVTGVGMVETTLALTRFLEGHGAGQEYHIDAVLNIGVGGAYVGDGTKNADLLQICLAEQEVFGDFGICYPHHMEALAEHLLHATCYNLDSDLVDRAEALLHAHAFSIRRGNFVTVCGVSATERRGAMLRDQYNGLCENMEGAAVARVCQEFNLPLLEMRTISNFVEDRDVERWKLREACDLAGKAAAILLNGLHRA